MKEMQAIILWRERPTGALVGAVHSTGHNSLQGTYFHLSHKNIFSCTMVFCFLILFALISNCMRLHEINGNKHIAAPFVPGFL
jgi:hypothetical protein